MRNPCRTCKNSEAWTIGPKRQYKHYYCKLPNYNCEKKNKYKDWQFNQRRYIKSDVKVSCLDDIFNHEWFWIFEKPRHQGFVRSTQLQTVKTWIDKGLYIAIEKKNDENKI